MNFSLTEQQEKMRAIVKDLAKKEVAPTATERDEQERFDRSIFEKMAEQGLTGILWPKEYGGMGADYISYMIAIEEISRACASMGVTLSVHTSLAGWPIFTYGTEAQKQHYLRALAEGKKMGAFALTEENAGSDAAAMETTAKRDGDHYILNGKKIFITNGGVADLYIVIALTDAEKRTRGMTAFIVDADTEGLSFGKEGKKMGIRSSPTTDIYFDKCRIPAENVLGQPGDGFKIAMSTLDGGRNGIAAQALGIAQAAMDAAVDYATTRKQFGKTISEQQGISFKLADMATKIEASRLLIYQVAWREGEGIPYSRESAMSKLFASNTAVEVTTEAVQVLGGRGYIRGNHVERYMRDAKITQIYEGTNEIQRLVISKLLFAQ